MSFGFSNEEDDDFGSISTNSNLASIFSDLGVQQSSSKSLVYTAPKQPPNKPVPITKSMSQAVIAATAVTCYKLNNEKYEALPGKIGFALLSENESKTCSIILYQNKQKPLASVRVTTEFSIISQPNNFCTFYDDHLQNWAVLFESKEVAQKFLGEIDQMKNVLAEHINKPSSTETVSYIDRTDGLLPTPLETQANQESSNKTKLISRIAKLGQPILPLSGAIVAEDNSDSEQLMQSSSVPESLKDRTKPRKAARPVPTLVPQPSDRIDFNTTLNSMVVPSHQYAPLMSGQQHYPMMQFLPPAFSGTQSNSNHHFDTLMSENRMQNSEVRMHLCRLTDKIDLLLQKTGVLESDHKDRNNRSPEHLDAFATDMQKLHLKSNDHTNKLNLILSEISASSKTMGNPLNPAEAIEQLLTSERQIWLTRRKEFEGIIQHLKQENDRMVHQIGEKSGREKEMDVRIQLLQEENDRFKDDVETSIRNRPIIDGTLNQLREENIRLTSLLDKSLLKEIELESQCKETREKLDYYESRFNETDSCLFQFKSLVEDNKRKLSDLQEHAQKLEKESAMARSYVESLQLELKNAEVEMGNKSNRDEEQEPVEEKVKTIMNKVYKEITKRFEPDESYTFHYIKSTVSAVIRDITLAVLNKEPTVEPTLVSQAMDEERDNPDHSITSVIGETYSAKNVDTVVQGDKCIQEENENIREDIVDTIQSENESKEERSISFIETLHSSLAAASLQNEHGTTWKPDPPPPPLFDDFDNEDDWLA